jgi:hypothetical protein
VIGAQRRGGLLAAATTTAITVASAVMPGSERMGPVSLSG